MKIAVSWDVKQCGSCNYGRFGGAYLCIIRVTICLHSVRRLLLTANVVPSLSILVTLMMEGLISSGTSDATRVTRRYISGDSIL
jgi:hypothetical protein